MIARIVIGSGGNRRVFELPRDKGERMDAAKDLKRFFWRSEGAFHKARRRGIRAVNESHLHDPANSYVM